MPRRRHQLGPADHAVLGLLALGPRHGYELAAHLGPRGELGLICTLGLSNMYALLHALEGLGYVTAETSRVSGGPPRKVFHLTPAGAVAFRRWLSRPVRRIREIRQDFMLKLFFSQRLGSHNTRALLDRQIAACRAHLAELESLAALAPPNSFSALVASGRKNAARATIAWLMESRGKVKRGAPYPAGRGAEPRGATLS